MYLDFEPGTHVQLLDANRTGTVLEVEDDHYIVGLHSDQYAGGANRAELVDAWPHEVVLVTPSPAQIQAGADAIAGSMLPASTARALAEAVLRAAQRAKEN